MTDIAALMIGRGGSSLRDKNILPVKGVPLLLWPAAAARGSSHIGSFYISSDDDRILRTAARAGYRPIKRPAELASATAQSCDAVHHAVGVMERRPDVVVVQHANIATVTTQMIDECIGILLREPSASAVVPVHRSPGAHPLWAKLKDADGTLVQAVAGNPSANRQALPDCFFPDHSFWVLRTDAILSPGGQPPWPCMGGRIIPYETDGGVDVHEAGDLIRAEEWLQRKAVAKPTF